MRAPTAIPQQQCLSVSPACPVEATTYGYYPNLGANAFFLAIWAALFLAQSGLAIKYKTWSYSLVLAAGSLMEAIGYIGRIIMHSNPWSDPGFRIQIVCLILAPSFLAAGVYLTIKHLVLYFGPAHSRLKPKLYTWIFIGCDIISILIQAGGGGAAASADPTTPNGRDLLDVGNNLILAGIAFQVATMAVCGLLALDFGIRILKAKRAARTGEKNDSSDSGDLEVAKSGTRGKVFCGAIAFAYVTILIRCIYRLPEMAGGWGNDLMRNEKEFLILDGMMVLLATISMTAFHPGWTFPRMLTNRR